MTSATRGAGAAGTDEAEIEGARYVLVFSDPGRIEEIHEGFPTLSIVQIKRLIDFAHHQRWQRCA